MTEVVITRAPHVPAATDCELPEAQAAIPCASGADHDPEPPEFASPACAVREMEDGYMGYATRDELLIALGALPEAEHAGARVALQTAKYDQAMAISGVAQRPAFLDRGQGRVVCRLAALLPRVRDDVLHGDPAAMLKSHQDNIELATSHSRGGTGGEAP